MSRLDYCQYELVDDCYDWKNDNCDECNIFKAYCEGARRAKNSIVRCKDCCHGEHIQIPLWENRDIDKAPSQFRDFIKCHKFHIKGFNETLYLGDDDFCSYGERKE